MKREVVEGKDLRAYLEGEVPIPNAEDLDRELEDKRNGEGQVEHVAPGPAIRPSAPPAAASPAADLPARPDR
jgi:hypothetical protein